jgi:hypothetical protein
MAYAPTQRLSLVEKTPLPSFLLAPSGWAYNLLRITHTCHTLQSIRALGTLASKIASQSSLKASPQITIIKQVPTRHSFLQPRHCNLGSATWALQLGLQPGLQPGLPNYSISTVDFTSTIYNRPLYRFGSCELDGLLTIDLELPLATISSLVRSFAFTIMHIIKATGILIPRLCARTNSACAYIISQHKRTPQRVDGEHGRRHRVSLQEGFVVRPARKQLCLVAAARVEDARPLL